ncbi:hypothetical protein XENOCAPTIV_008667, partial [Xenoophorus captivus]
AHLDSAERQKRVEQDLNIDIQKQSAQLQEERSRSASLSQVNSWLREQLDQVDTVNNGLVESLLKARKEAQRFETRLRGERETYASRSSHEQARVRALWRQATSLRSTFTQLKTFTDSEKGSLEKLLSGLQQEVDSQRGEQNVLRSSSLDLQRQRDLLRQQREDLEMQLSRQHTEACRGEKAFQELERRYSDLRSELITVKESLDQITLEKEMLEDDNTSLSLALNKAKRQMQTLQEQLCACSKELDERTTAVKRAARDREELAKDKAALEVKLNCAERTACSLTQQLVALRSEAQGLLLLCSRAEKNSLETAIFESQELSTSLEAKLTRLEGERCSLNLANEALTREWPLPSKISLCSMPSPLAMKLFQPSTRDPLFSSEICISWAAVSLELLSQLTLVSLLRTNTHGSDK